MAAGSCSAWQVAARPGNVVLIGDFNATYDHAEFRQLLAGAGRKAVDVGVAAQGSRLIPTWPMDGLPLPGIVIDHIVTNPEISGGAYSVHVVPGTDHAAILATLSIPVEGLPAGNGSGLAFADHLEVGGLGHRADHDLVQVDVVRGRDGVADHVGDVLGGQWLLDPGVHLGGRVLVAEAVQREFLGLDQRRGPPRSRGGCARPLRGAAPR